MAARGFTAPGVKDDIRRPLQTSDSSETVGVTRFVKRGKKACASPTLFFIVASEFVRRKGFDAGPSYRCVIIVNFLFISTTPPR